MGGVSDTLPYETFPALLLQDNPPSALPYEKVSQINRPPPSQAFVFMDESQYSIEDGLFAVKVLTDVGRTTRRIGMAAAPAFRSPTAMANLSAGSNRLPGS